MMQPVMGSCPANMTCMMMTCGHDGYEILRPEYGPVPMIHWPADMSGMNTSMMVMSKNESENMTSMMSMMSMIQSGKMMPLGTIDA